MGNFMKPLLKFLIPVILVVASCVAVAGNQAELDEAVKMYYAGYPAEAISMIKPLALAGDIDAQYLLGNIIYSLSEEGNLATVGDPVRWYQMAAEQNSADAIYALGVIFHNRWIKSRGQKEAANAITYYQKALELGLVKAQPPLSKLVSRSGISLQKAEALVAKQGATSARVSTSRAQISTSETGSVESESTPAPLVDSLASTNTAMKSETGVENQSAAGSSDQKLQSAVIFENEPALTVTLAEITRHCQNYTQTGFNLFAQTIEAALFSGEATLESIKPDSSKSAVYSAELTHKQVDIVVYIDLRDVPKDVAETFEKGRKYAVPGIIVASKAVDSGCTVRVSYQSARN